MWGGGGGGGGGGGREEGACIFQNSSHIIHGRNFEICTLACDVHPFSSKIHKISPYTNIKQNIHIYQTQNFERVSRFIVAIV